MPEDRAEDIRIGTDIIEIHRFRDLDSDSAFYKKVFTDKEREYCDRFPEPASHYATTFAGKEAVIKAIRSFCNLTIGAIEILRDENGAPYVILQQDCRYSIRLSLSHSLNYAVAVAIAFVQSVTDQKHIQGLLDETIQQLLPGGEMS
jgi:holo-[acyl-carrier protein] synthase